ncbi:MULTISPECIES: 4a-hydroxytetrahydrobiopterin dehydratase [unclassified Massilia]|uniref:4a-hydroxytetrahydrobiopterin dehydratase n=1 Tax=unclassified Massilia TaxID=2609279 RepID=UPI00177F7A14|nr:MULTISPECIES: 4a-hydroxytetrahydrobiopterin dehydratase [unclassified Massilia]MBD8532829.1 4a-hydroxytetrahydrobiopterin dehydratase [Massilia sp. CFBP 13647]MBD8676190.1 4a-hydroxytetrahydrobiopterin dehydratase [Massilia sp. CFBP 13721]
MMLAEQRCTHGAPALSPAEVPASMAQVPDWQVDANRIVRSFEFRDYHETIAFVNALAAMIHLEDHHPELTVRYRHCIVAWTTHSAGNAISMNDLICAAKADAIYEERTRA